MQYIITIMAEKKAWDRVVTVRGERKGTIGVNVDPVSVALHELRAFFETEDGLHPTKILMVFDKGSTPFNSTL